MGLIAPPIRLARGRTRSPGAGTAASRGVLGGLLLLMLLATAPAVELRIGEPAVYKYELVQDVTWRSAGDELAYRTAMIWELLLLPRGTTEDGRLRLQVVVTQIDARHRGPGSEHRLRAGGARATEGADDPLLGNLVALMDIPLTLTVDPTTGRVTAVEGHEAIVDALEARHPGRAGGTSPIATAAAEAYAPDRLARLWSTLLAVPRSGIERVPLEPPLSGEAIRRWEGDRYTLALPADAAPTAVLHTSPGRVALQLERLSGSGSVRHAEGLLLGAEGTIEATFAGEALTQDLVQQHRIRWTLARRVEQPEGAGDDAAEARGQPPGDDASPDADGTGDTPGDLP